MDGQDAKFAKTKREKREKRQSALMSTIQRQRKPQTPDVEYPTGDGKPLAETRIHLNVMIETIHALDDQFAAQPNVHVGGNRSPAGCPVALSVCISSATERNSGCSIPRQASVY